MREHSPEWLPPSLDQSSSHMVWGKMEKFCFFFFLETMDIMFCKHTSSTHSYFLFVNAVFVGFSIKHVLFGLWFMDTRSRLPVVYLTDKCHSYTQIALLLCCGFYSYICLAVLQTVCLWSLYKYLHPFMTKMREEIRLPQIHKISQWQSEKKERKKKLFTWSRE